MIFQLSVKSAAFAALAWGAFSCNAQSAGPPERPLGPPSAPGASINGPNGSVVQVPGPTAAPSVGPFEGRNTAGTTELPDTRGGDRMRPAAGDANPNVAPPSTGTSAR